MKKIIQIIVSFILLGTSVSKAGDLSVALGNFDYSDKSKKASMLDLTYGFAENKTSTFLGEVVPVFGAFVTADSAAMIYSGAKIDYRFGSFVVTPSFTPGIYSKGNGKDLGHAIEFKSQINLGFELGSNINVSAGYSHVSNASFGDKNPGANSYSFNFLTRF
jgi:lipid A 3-O-deacylase